jgi:protein involved in polysaccharide export with SLBB domain
MSRGIAGARSVRVLLLVSVALLGCMATLGAQARPRTENDFREGDRIVLRVAGETELSDTFTVVRGPAVLLPVVGSVSLTGVARDSIERVLTTAIGRFYRDPLVHARALVRVAVLGEVMRPGFYAMPVDLLLSDAIMAAGGPTPIAQVDRLKILRHGVESPPGDSVAKALAQGKTLSQIDVRSEDQLIVPRAHDSTRTLQVVGAWLAIPVALITLFVLLRR